MSQSRNYCFTLNNYSEAEFTAIKNIECKYIVVGEEVGKEGTPHLQGYVEFASPKRLTALKKMNNRIHWEKRQGTAQQASDYCKKDKTFFEKGELSKQGARTDLDTVKDQILEGKAVDEIVVEAPMLYHQYGRTLDRIEDIALRKKFRSWMTEGLWLHGKTGVGKSHAAFEGFTPETHYVLPEDNGWWDGYKGQETVIINDFRGHLPYSFLLQLVDKYPLTVKRRGREPIPFLAKRVIVTSSLPPEGVYHNLSEKDSLDQLLRRFTVQELF